MQYVDKQVVWVQLKGFGCGARQTAEAAQQQLQAEGDGACRHAKKPRSEPQGLEGEAIWLINAAATALAEALSWPVPAWRCLLAAESDCGSGCRFPRQSQHP